MSKSVLLRPHHRSLQRLIEATSVRALLHSLSSELLVAASLCLGLLLGLAFGYAVPTVYTLPFEYLDGLPTQGLGEVEYGPTGTHRWTAPEARIRVPGVGAAPGTLSLEFHNPGTEQSRRLTIRAGEHVLGHLAPRDGWQRVSLALPSAGVDRWSGDLDLQIAVEPPIYAENRELGIALRSLRLVQSSGSPVPQGLALSLLLLGGLVALPLRSFGVRRRVLAPVLGVGIALLALLLAGPRVGVLLGIAPLREALLIALVALLPLAVWARSVRPAERPWVVGLAVVTLLCFVVRVAGMYHPQFVQIDHTLRINQIKSIAIGGREIVQQSLGAQYEWGQDVAVPYSLLAYDLFVPIAGWFSVPALVKVVEASTAALDASIVPLLWLVARRSGLNARASFWSAALFALLPVGYLYFHDGSYPTIIGLWVVVATLWLSSIFAERPSLWRWLLCAAAIALSMLMYVTHLAFVPALFGLAALSALLLGDRRLRRSAIWLLCAVGSGVALALLGYYGAHLPELFTRTIPSYVARLSGGETIGRDSALLPGPLLGGAWEQLWGHYRVVPVALALLGVLWALGMRRERWLAHLLAGYGIFLLLTMLADLRFGLWNKHMYFALPGICLAAGPVLAAVQRRGRVASLVVWSLAAYLAWSGLEAWALRVVWYIWSLQTL